MADNNEILNELFWKRKKSFADKQKETQAQYAPVSKTDDVKSLFVGNPSDGIVVSDTGEVKKRIVGALGMAMGNNTIKSMASKSIKSFPIIISDDVSPETAVMVKTMMEEQYASYIDLLVSNQIINLTDYEAGSMDGNIAIQALNKIDGTDFSKNRIARQAQSGKLSMDDVFKNSPVWQFVKTNEELNYKTGNPIVDLFLEDAIIVPSQYTNTLLESNIYTGTYNPTSDKDIEKDFPAGAAPKLEPRDVFLNTATNDIFVRDNNGNWTNTTDSKIKKEIEKLNKSKDPVRRMSDAIQSIAANNDVANYNKYRFGASYDTNAKEFRKSYERLITPTALVNADDLETSLNQSVAEILSGANAKNENEKKIAEFLRDRFEKASYLLAAYRISGSEYLSYLTDRLGIPISERTRINLLAKYPTSKVVFKGTKMWDEHGKALTVSSNVKEARQAIDKSEKYVLDEVIPSVTHINGKDILAITGGTVAGAGVGAGIGAAAATMASVAMAPVIFPALAAAAVVGGVGTAIYRFIKKSKMNHQKMTAIEGWERVESLIDEMDETRDDLIKKMKSQNLGLDDQNSVKSFMEEDNKRFMNFSNQMDRILKRSVNSLHEEITNLKGYMPIINDNIMERHLSEILELDEEIKSDIETFNELVQLDEAAKYIINTKKPGDIIVKQQKMKNKDVAGIVPVFGTRDNVAYGSVEYDKRDIKDRKFNEPLILTIKFKERYSDGKYADNELTAVIGILGVITRVPSEEMAYILRSNAEGKTLDNFFKGDESNNAKDLIGNVISNFMGTKYAEKLPASGKVWANLEKVSSLAMANKLSGNNNGNISNAHLVFSQKEIDQVKSETGINYLKNARLTAQLMKKYSAFMVMVCNDAMQYVYSFSDPDAISWEDAPYSAYMGKSNADQMLSAFTQATRMKL